MRPLLVALAADTAAVLLFAAVGRRSHGGSGDLAGLAVTAWPFLAALAVGWLLAAVAGRRAAGGARPGPRWPSGPLVWLVTVLGGHGLRLLSGQGSSWSFLVVTAVVLLVLLVGWRAVAVAVGHLLRRRATPWGPPGQRRARGTAPSRR